MRDVLGNGLDFIILEFKNFKLGEMANKGRDFLDAIVLQVELHHQSHVLDENGNFLNAVVRQH